MAIGRISTDDDHELPWWQAPRSAVVREGGTRENRLHGMAGGRVSLRKNSRDATRERAQRALTHNGRSRVCLVSGLLVLVLTTAALGYFGIGDLTSAFTFPGRLTGAVLVAVAFTAFLGTAALVDHWLFQTFPNSGLVALLGAFLALLANLTLFFELLANADSNRWKVLFGTLMLGSAWTVIVLWRTLTTIPTPKRVATALLATIVIAVGNFGYQNLYLPSQREVRPVIKLTPGDPVTSPDRKEFSVPVDITLENHSDKSFDVLGTEFHTMAQRVSMSPKDLLLQQWRSDAEQWKSFEGTHPLSRREIHQPGELVQAQPWMPYGTSIAANDTVAARVVVQLPMNTSYDQVAFYASAHLTRKDRVSLQNLDFQGYSWHSEKLSQRVKRLQGYDYIAYQSRLHENNAIDENTRDPRYVTVYWRFDAHGSSIIETIGTEDGKDEPKKSTEDRYGVRIVETGPVERILWDIKHKQ
ncbi:hypothetical protein [Streptomyces sp. NPDC001980]|uniref:hypothetical protein n=1 Tax=Streptomyces sp. NPDC001980 TaxID=3157126 RepID=UPI00331BAB21